MLDSWLPFLMYGVLAFVIPASMILMSFVFATRPARRTRTRRLPFESGVSEGPPKANRFTVFDIEIVYLYPLGVVLKKLGWFGFAELGFFIAILALAYVYIWRKGALKWR